MPFNRLAWVLVAAACATFVWRPGIASADLIASAPITEVPGASAAPGDAPPRDLVAHRLAGVGVAAGDIDARLAEMSEADLQALAASPEQVQFAGDEDALTTFLLVAAGVILLFVTLWLTLGNNNDDDDDAPVAPVAPPEPG